MRTQSKTIAIAMAALFVAWLAAAPAAAAVSGAAGPGTGKAGSAAKPLSFLGFQDDEEDADTPAAFSKLSFKLYGGYNHMLAGDVNEGSDYYFEILEAYNAEGYGTSTGNYKPLHGGYNFGADLIYQLTPSLGVGLGIGYMRGSSSSLATWTDTEVGDYTLTARPTLSAMPLRLGLFLTLPVGKKLDLIANAGAAYYLGLKLEAVQGQESSLGEEITMTIAGSERAGADIGFHGSLGFEYKLSPRLGVFVEGAGRYARFKNFESVTMTYESSMGGTETDEGVLYLLDYDYLEGYDVSGFVISDTPPPSDVPAREPKMDLSGFSLQAGFRIRF